MDISISSIKKLVGAIIFPSSGLSALLINFPWLMDAMYSHSFSSPLAVITMSLHLTISSRSFKGVKIAPFLVNSSSIEFPANITFAPLSKKRCALLVATSPVPKIKTFLFSTSKKREVNPILSHHLFFLQLIFTSNFH